MSETKLKDETIDGHKFEITVRDNGEFQTKILGDWVNAPSYKALIDKVRKLIRRAGRIAIPLTLISDKYNNRQQSVPEITQVTITGVHGSNRNILYKDEKTGVTEQASSWGNDFYKRLTGPEIQSFMALTKAARDAADAVDKWKTKHKVSPHTLIEEAAEKLADKPTTLADAVAREDAARG